MRVTEALIRQSNQKKQKPKDDVEETLSYQERKYEYWAMNQNKQAFDSPFSGGINKAESIFDKGAIFRTQGK